MRIGLITDHMVGGGAERSTLTLASALAARGHQVDLLLYFVQGPLVAFIPSAVRLITLNTRVWTKRRQFSWLRDLPASVRVVHMGPRWSGKWLTWLRAAVSLRWQRKYFGLLTPAIARAAIGIAQYIRRERPQVLLTSQYMSEAAALLAKRMYGGNIRIVIISRCSLLDRDASCLHQAHILFPEASSIIAVSRALADELASETPTPRERIAVIYNPVFTPELESLASATPEHPWLRKKERSVILAAGRLQEQKDYPTLLRAFARLAGRTDMRLVILGEGTERPSLEILVRDLGLEGKVDMPGWVPNPFAFMSRARLFVLSSRWEGLPGSLIQAMGCGCPVVSTDCPTGPREILEGGRWGALVSVGDDAALAQAMEAALEAPPDRDALRRRASFFSVERATEQYEKVLLDSASLASGP